jgi:hypothetical protein
MIDFNLALQKIDPETNWDIHPLTGGLVNFTIRATLKHDSKQNSISAKSKAFNLSPYESLIVKYAAPYVASIGNSAPFSQFRQVSCT